MKLTKLATLGALAVSVAGLSACNNTMEASTVPTTTVPTTTVVTPAVVETQPMATMNVVQIAQSDANFSLLVEALQAAGLAGALSDTSASYTILAPNNAAFVNVLKETGMTKDQLFANKPLLTKILTSHVLKGNTPVYQKHVKPGNYTMLSTDTVVITKSGRLMDESGRTAKILQTDIPASNGVIHVIDTVLLPK